jgi:hypothetical protein
MLEKLVFKLMGNKLIDMAWEAVTGLIDIAERVHKSVIALTNQPHYVKVSTAFGRVFCLVVFLSDGVVPPEEVMKKDGHNKPLFVKKFQTGLHSVPFAYAYLVSFPKNSERLSKIKWLKELKPTA